MTRFLRGAALVAAGWLLVYLATFTTTVAAAGGRPKLIVLLVVDQMRADYIDRFQGQWQGGLKRLVTTGASFRLAEYPYANTVTCAGHATIATGALPSTHGMILNSWFDRTEGRTVTCTDDPSASNVGYGRDVEGHDGLGRLRTTTLADELRAQLDPPGHAVAFSLKARSAITLGGRAPDAVAWFDDGGTWVTSTAFSKGPVPLLTDLLARTPVTRDFGRTWDRSLPIGRYLYPASALGVTPPDGMTPAFPHALAGGGAAPDATFYEQWQNSPYSDEFLGRVALDAVRSLHFDRVGSTNLMAVSFSALDKVGHDYGPNSHEVQDVLVRLDRTLGTLFDGLDAFVGPENYVVALSADHGVAPLPERALAEGLPAGRLNVSHIVDTIEASLANDLGPGPHVEKFVHTEVYLKAGAADALAAHPSALRHVRAALAAIPGVDGLFTAAELEATSPTEPGLRGRFARSHFAGRSGDLTVVFRPYWLDDETGTSHGTPYSYDARVPLILMGAGIGGGDYRTTAAPVDIAPTLAHLAGITLPRTDGRVLAEAIAPTTSTSR